MPFLPVHNPVEIVLSNTSPDQVILHMVDVCHSLTSFRGCGYKDRSSSNSQHFFSCFLVSLSFAQLSIPAMVNTTIEKLGARTESATHGRSHELLWAQVHQSGTTN